MSNEKSEKKYYCKSCNKEIIWVEMIESGHKMPIEADSIKIGLVLSDNLKKGAIRKTGLSHFARCPEADQFRSNNKRYRGI